MRGTSLPNGDLIVCGGDTGQGCKNMVEHGAKTWWQVCEGDTGPTFSDEYLHYKDFSNHWTNVGTMKTARFSHSSVWIDGCLFTTGGFCTLEHVEYDSDDSERALWISRDDWQATSHHEMFSIQGGVKVRREMPTPLGGHTATMFAAHKIIVCGGSPTRYVNKSFSLS